MTTATLAPTVITTSFDLVEMLRGFMLDGVECSDELRPFIRTFASFEHPEARDYMIVTVGINSNPNYVPIVLETCMKDGVATGMFRVVDMDYFEDFTVAMLSLLGIFETDTSDNQDRPRALRDAYDALNA